MASPIADTLIVDDWHRLDQGTRAHLEHLFEHETIGVPAAILVVGAESVQPPVLTNCRHYVVDRYTISERNAVLQTAFTADAVVVQRIVENELPSGFEKLLLEPVLLRKFADIMQSTLGPPVAPANLQTLFRRLLETLLSSQGANAPARADEITCACAALSWLSGPYNLAALGPR